MTKNVYQLSNISKRLSGILHRNRVEKVHTKQRYQKKNIVQINQEFNEFIEKFSEIGNQNRKYNKEHGKYISNIFHKEISAFIKQFSRYIKLENTKLLEQISEQAQQQISGFIEQISEENNRQNSVFIKQNKELIKEILSQSLRNHGTINKKFDDFVIYQTLSELRENLTTIKTNVIILERLDKTQLKIFHNMYLKYQNSQSKIPSLDITQGIIIVKILFPLFFTQMLRKVSFLKSQFEDDSYTEMRDTIQSSDNFFKNFNRDSELDKMKKILDSAIGIVDNKLTELIN